MVHMIEMHEQLQEMSDVVKVAAESAQKRQKGYYDHHARKRVLSPGDKVLVLLPSLANKLKLEWVGPYQVLRRLNDVKFEVETPGRCKKKKVVHINLLKKWNEPQVNLLANASVVSTLDLAKGYWQIPMAPDSREKTAFTTPFRLYEFEVMPFGLHNAPASFQRTMNHVLCVCQNFAQAYLDDIIVFSSVWLEHIQHLREVLVQLQRAGLTVKLKKCRFSQTHTRSLGHVIGGGEVRPDPEKVQSIRDCPKPKTKKDVRSFLGLAGYYRCFIPNFSTVPPPSPA